MIYNTCDYLFKAADLRKALSEYFSNDLINELYFKPKKVNKELIENKLNDSEYMNKVERTLDFYKQLDLEDTINNRINQFENDTSYKIDDYNLYVIIGLGTTTIYSTQYNGKDVTVLLLESTDGRLENLEMLLAHEYTHWVRKQVFKRDIFENCIGERFVVEGIGCNYSREIVPEQEESSYCIVNKEVFAWVKSNIEIVEAYMSGSIDSNELMSDYFYMFADTSKTGMPARTGYVYGYLKIKQYLEKNNLKIKDIIAANWEDLL